MILFFEKPDGTILAVGVENLLTSPEIEILNWLFTDAILKKENEILGTYIGPRIEMVSPWSTNAVEITKNCGVKGIQRIEQFFPASDQREIDPMLQQSYQILSQSLFTPTKQREKVQEIQEIAAYNEAEGLALSQVEIEYLESISSKLGRSLTDSEIFGFSQINSEHCRHKIFNGEFIIDGEKKDLTLFQWIKKTSAANPNKIVSAYKDNVAFIEGPVMQQFAPKKQDVADYFETSDFQSVLSLKAETHNFPTTVEPFNGAATGAGGEIRDRLAGGQGSFPLAGTAVYMTSYPRLTPFNPWEQVHSERKWLYQKPKEILIKASNGASDFGNKYGQPLIVGSLLTFEHTENNRRLGFDKVIMLAGGVGYAKKENAIKKQVKPGQKIVVLGGDNYRIGMGGGAVSSVNTGEFTNKLELNAVQRSNPEMQKRAANVIRALAERKENPIQSIHDHGAGGHLNCLSELVENTGGIININQLPIGDPTLSYKEILSNESQERMGLVIEEEDVEYLIKVAERERSPVYIVGETTSDHQLLFKDNEEIKPFDLSINQLFGASPKTILTDNKTSIEYEEIIYATAHLETYIKQVMRLESVACKDWLTNKVDRSVTGKVALQQTVGEIQFPLNNLGVMALDFQSHKGVATSLGHAPIAALIDPAMGSRLALVESMTNLVFAPLAYGRSGISLSANWMWPAKVEGENSRLYEAVQGLAEFAIQLGINVPTGKDSLSMTQKYPNGDRVYAPGTVIISSIAEVSDVRNIVLPVIQKDKDSVLLYVPFSTGDFVLGGSAFAQTLARIGKKVPNVEASHVSSQFDALQQLVRSGDILAGHDVSSGGLITTLLEMCFPNSAGGIELDVNVFKGEDIVKILFNENPAVVIQLPAEVAESLKTNSSLEFFTLGKYVDQRSLTIDFQGEKWEISIDEMRSFWLETSLQLDKLQTNAVFAEKRLKGLINHPLNYNFPKGFSGTYKSLGIDPFRKESSGLRAAIIREKGVNGDREMAYALWLAGFDVKDIHMTDLISGREDLSDIQMIVFVGGFSNSDVLGSAKGWAGSFLFNPLAKEALDRFYARHDTLSLGVCNGCQAIMELECIYTNENNHPKMHHNASGKFESAFLSVDILPNSTVLFGNMIGARLGIWMAHGEGRFRFANDESHYVIPIKYSTNEFPGNPNGSDFAAAAVASRDGRHVAIMPHLERSLFPWNWAHYLDKKSHEVSPWMIPFKNAFEWVKKQK